MDSSIERTKTIAKNTLLLYFRMLFTMGVGLYISRLVLNALGVDNYGIYTVVGGMVAMFSFLTGSMANAISRYLTFFLGKNDQEELIGVFSTSFYSQLALAFLVGVSAEIIGLWFLENKLIIPEGRMEAASWAVNCSILVFVINILTVPFNASIIAHEKMSAFAYISIVEVFLKLLVAVSLYCSEYDSLKIYTLLLVFVAFIVFLLYYAYCKIKFEECRVKYYFDKGLFKEMVGFTGWSMIGNGAVVLNTQGVNICTNMFFGVALNAARGIADQVNAAVMQFVNNFTTALNPQITKSYAIGDHSYLFQLVFRGSRISFFLMLIFALPLFFEADVALDLWLKNYPPKAPLFVRLVLIAQMIDFLGNTTARAVWATGRVRRYYLYTSCVSLFVLPITYILFSIGFSPETSYFVFMLIYTLLIPIRLFVLRSLIPSFEPKMFLLYVIKPAVFVTIISSIAPIILYTLFNKSLLSSLLIIVVSIVSVIITAYVIGLDQKEKEYIANAAVNTIKKIRCIA